MREILFRGKRADGRWIYGDIIHNGVDENNALIAYNPGDKYICMVEIHDKWCLTRKVLASAVGQYTGLKDKNGKRIFEGDILKWDSKEWGSEHFEVVRWDYELFDMRRNDWHEFCEVVGNVHDNPELLEVTGHE